MKTNLFLIGIFVLLACFLTNCDQEDLTMDNAQVTDSATERKKGGNGGGNGNGNGGGGDGGTAALYLVTFTGNVSYPGGSYEIDDPTGSSGVVQNTDTVFAMVEKDTKKFSVMTSIKCPDYYTTFRITGLDTLDNPCFDESVCVFLSMRQYDKGKDRQKVFVHINYSDGRLTMRGYIQDQPAGQENLIPENVGGSTVIVMDRVNLNPGTSTGECEMDNTFFNDDNGNGNYQPGVAILADQIPDQSLIITRLDPDDFNPCNPGITCQ